MIGISVSGCIRDIVAGQVKIEEVERIIAGTSCGNQAAWDCVIRDYRKSYWRENPDEGERILWQLIAEGKILQPRLENKNRYPMLQTANGRRCWVNTESEIIWSDQN
jgi:hypothetical protein